MRHSWLLHARSLLEEGCSIDTQSLDTASKPLSHPLECLPLKSAGFCPFPCHPAEWFRSQLDQAERTGISLSHKALTRLGKVLRTGIAIKYHKEGATALREDWERLTRVFLAREDGMATGPTRQYSSVEYQVSPASMVARQEGGHGDE